MTSKLTQSLWERAAPVIERNLKNGKLQPIATTPRTIRDGEIPFVVYTALPKPRSNLPKATSGNPFLPYDPEMCVEEVLGSHALLLNKYPVVKPHLLLITQAFEAQHAILSYEDFLAAAKVLRPSPAHPADDALVFYNSSPTAGASQPHKHLQLVPTRTFEPMRALLDATLRGEASLPFENGLCVLPPPFAEESIEQRAEAWHQVYLSLHSDLLEAPGDAYNLLFTQSWMLFVPRRKEHALGMSLNALAFSGTLFVKEESLFEALHRWGPIAALQEVAGTPE